MQIVLLAWLSPTRVNAHALIVVLSVTRFHVHIIRKLHLDLELVKVMEALLEAFTKWTEFPLQAVPTLTLKIPGESYSTIPLTEATTDDPENTSTLKKIFARLHFILLPSKTQIEIPVDTKGTIEEILERMVNSDDSALNHCLCSLATGQDDGSLPPTSNLNFSTQIFMAAENLRQAMNPSGSELRRLVNRALTAFSNNTNRLISIFQKLGACYSRQNQSRLQARKVDKLKADFLVNVKINKYCYAIVLFDNLGFKNRQGFRKGLGYEQYTIIKIIVNTLRYIVTELLACL